MTGKTHYLDSMKIHYKWDNSFPSALVIDPGDIVKFNLQESSGGQINPNSTPTLKKPLRFDFFHDKEQQKYISNQVKMYSAQAEGMGRLLFQSDSRLLFRSFSKSDQI